MNIPKGFEEHIQKFIEKDSDLSMIFGLANLTGNKEAAASVMGMATASCISQMINPTVPEPLYPLPTNKDFNGDFILGQGIEYIPRIDVNQFIRHALISGSSGAGKTNTALFFLKNFQALGKKSLHLGFKRSIRYLSREMPIVVLTAGESANFSWSILDAPPGVSQLVWDDMVMKLFCESQFIAEAGESMLLSAITYLRKNNQRVDFFMLYQYIRGLRVKAIRELNWKATIENRLLAFLTMCGGMLRNKNKFPLEKLIENYNIELELDRAGEFKSFLANLPPAYLYLHRISNNIRGSSLITPILCDELNDLVNKSMEKHSLFEPTILQFLRVAREFGLGLILFTNEPTAVPNTIKAQTSTKAIMHSVNSPDIEDMGRSMNLSKEQMELCQNLPVGIAIFKLSDLRQPFLVQFPLIEIRKDLTDEDVNENNKRLLAGTEFESILWKYEEVTPEVNQGQETNTTAETNTTTGTNEMPEKSKTPETSKPSKTPEETIIEQEPTTQLTNEERSFLNDVYNHEFLPLLIRFERLGLSAGSGSRLTARLVSLNLIRKIEINLGGRGNSITLLELTGEAYQLLGLEPKKYGRGSGFEHYFWQVRVRDELKAVGNVETEGNIKGKFVDISLRLPDGSLIGIEIEVSSAKEHVVDQIKKDIEAGVDFLIIGFKDKKLFERMQKTISASNKLIQDRVRLCLLPGIVKEANELINNTTKRKTLF